MPGAVAAIGGAKRGRAIGQAKADIKRREACAKARRDAEERYRKEAEMVNKVMEAYDKDKSDDLDPDQITEMLVDYSFKLKGHTEKPTKDEVDSLLTLCDRTGNGKIAKKELMGVLTTWFAYIEKGDETRSLLEKHDLSKTGKINHGELAPLLKELNDGQEVPDDVLKWIWMQADLTGDGSLSAFELTRAVAAWYVWLPEDQPGGKPGMLAGQMDKEAMPEKQQRVTSACCTVQ